MTHRVKVVHVGGKGKVKEKRNLTPFKDLFISETVFKVNECNTELETFKTFKIAFKNIFVIFEKPSVMPWPDGNFIERMLSAAIIISWKLGF